MNKNVKKTASGLSDQKLIKAESEKIKKIMEAKRLLEDEKKIKMDAAIQKTQSFISELRQDGFELCPSGKFVGNQMESGFQLIELVK